MSKLTLQDKMQVAHWLRGGATLAEVRAIPNTGLVGNVRFSERAREMYVHLWTWSAERFGGHPGVLHMRADLKLGRHGLDTRIARTNAQIRRIMRQW